MSASDPALVIVAAARLGPLDARTRGLLRDVLALSANLAEGPIEIVNTVPPRTAEMVSAPAGPGEQADQVEEAGEQPSTATIDYVPSARAGRRTIDSGVFATRAETIAADPHGGQAFEGDGLGLTSTIGEPPPPDPIMSARRLTMLISTVARRPRLTGEFDAAAVIREAASARPVLHLPRRVVWSVSGPSLLVLDRSDAMAPFESDAVAVQAAFQRVMGAGAEIATVTGGLDPLARRGARRTVVLAFTDLGIGRAQFRRRHINAAEWNEFGTRVRAGRGRFTPLVPYGRPRWPDGPASRSGLVVAETTTVRDARRAASKG